MEITAITPQKHDAARCNIEVDGRFFCGMQLLTVMEHRLKVGSIVTEEELSQLQLAGERQTALDKALTHIAASMKTERDIRDFLRRKGYLQDVADYVVGKMKGYGYLDDEAYARAYAESAGKRKGGRLIRMELKRKGVSDQAIAAALSEGVDEGAAAKAALEKYLRGKKPDEKTLRKAYAHLMSRGFDYDTARSALAGLRSDADDEWEES
ncbi:MAG TPA: RecX family transcriptional regulator [Firmicutes bacterium]|nr:RecX family transcriptional regulator [Bacillota bacterium]